MKENTENPGERSMDADGLDSEYLKEVYEGRGKEVEAIGDRPFESPSKFVPGPFYADVGERIGSLAEPDLPIAAVSGAEGGESKLPVDRRDFMRLFSASAVFASTAACVRRPEEKAVPYSKQPVDKVPGVPTYYATTCGECSVGCGVVVKTREGRPVKIEGHDEHFLSQGATCALGQSSLQGLYHPERRKKPLIVRGNRHDEADWLEVFEHLGTRVKGKRIGILTGGSTGHRQSFFRDFLQRMGSPVENLFTYDANTLIAAQLRAHELMFGVQGLPRSELHKADCIVGVGSDFLEVGIAPVHASKSFAQSFNFSDGQMGRFVQFESGMTATGARANERHPIRPGSEILVTLALVRALEASAGARGSASERAQIRTVLNANSAAIDSVYTMNGYSREQFATLAEEMLQRRSVVLAGGSLSFDENATSLQMAAIMANLLLGAYTEILSLTRGWMRPPVEVGGIERFLAKADEIDVLFVIDANPAFNVPGQIGVGQALERIETVVTINPMPSETDHYASYILNGHHYLESWGDEEPVAGYWSLRQPAIRPAFNSRQAEDILMWVAAANERPMGHREYREYIENKWQAVRQAVGARVDFPTFFNAALRRGFIGLLRQQAMPNVRNFAANFQVTPVATEGLRLMAPLDPRLRDGRGADRPVLQEVGDAMTTIAWDSFVLLNPHTAKKLGLRRNELISVEGPAGKLEVALFPMPGLHPDAVIIPRGNGHKKGVAMATDGIGVDPLQLFSGLQDVASREPVTANVPVSITGTGRFYRLAAMQKHNDIANRSDIVKKVSLAKAAKYMGKLKDLDTVPDLYPKLEQGDYRWGMSIDLTACVGCSACMVACATENNVPQIGREQILMGREMHWLRLDRYFFGDVDNPEVTIQPVMCQHCNHAPCEAVCPVYATTHDPEGLNSQTYNRCVGTRYCANACPYKVRRFNWFTHKWNSIDKNPLHRNPRAMNPDVTVRTRGIMEKCTFCIQRIQTARYNASDRGAKIVEGDVKTACQQVCPTNAIVFGDLKDENSQAAKLRKDNRAFLMLGQDPEHGHYGLKTLPNVSYLAEVTLHEHGKDNHHG